MEEDAIECKTIRHLSWRLLPFLFVLYIFSYLTERMGNIAGVIPRQHFESVPTPSNQDHVQAQDIQL
ncbi:MAG: hypothetical protein M3O41_08615 [Pseudomonadota bacterium]|nr:hypothetical protein [Pseudomonadota bacterium]